VLRQWARLAGQHMRTTLVSQGSSLIAPVVPLLLCAPKFLDGSMTLGQVMQAASAFTIVQTAFGWLVDNYPRLADWNACARRIASLMMSLDGLERAEKGRRLWAASSAARPWRGDAGLERSLVTLERRHRVVVEQRSPWSSRASGCWSPANPGIRQEHAGAAIAGLCRGGAARVNFHPDRRLFMLPQKPYVPSGTLRRAGAYPGAETTGRTKDICRALTRSGCDHLKEKIAKTRPWDRPCPAARSSARLCAAAPAQSRHHRADEATSALDEKSQDKMMKMVTDALPKATIVSVAHRVELEAFHSRKIVLSVARAARNSSATST
jgi:putative ATP-binding cassette transporter